MNCNTEQPCSGPIITATWPTRGVSDQPPRVEDHPDDSTNRYPPSPSPHVSTPYESKQNILSTDESVQNNESWRATSEKEYVEEFWLGLGRQERKNMVDVEIENVLESMRWKRNCGCGPCRLRWFVPSFATLGLEYTSNNEPHSHA